MDNKKDIVHTLEKIGQEIDKLDSMVKKGKIEPHIFKYISDIKVAHKDLILLGNLVYDKEYKIEENLELIREHTKSICNRLTYKNVLTRCYNGDIALLLADE